MTILDKLERRFGRFAIPHVTLGLIFGQLLVFGMISTGQFDPARMVLIPSRVFEGEVWRVFTFLFTPPLRMHWILLAFAWYIFFLMGSALEQHWGNFRYNLYLLIAWIATVAVSILVPGSMVTNGFIFASVFLAFAFLNPNFELMLMFILPIKVKWLAAVMWGFYGLTILVAPWPTKLAVLASVCNFLAFFGKDLIQIMRARQRRMEFEAQRAAQKEVPVNCCHVCGRSDLSDPELDFRYCSKCEGHYCYCEEHLRDHEHVRQGGKEEE